MFRFHTRRHSRLQGYTAEWNKKSWNNSRCVQTRGSAIGISVTGFSATQLHDSITGPYESICFGSHMLIFTNDWHRFKSCDRLVLAKSHLSIAYIWSFIAIEFRTGSVVSSFNRVKLKLNTVPWNSSFNGIITSGSGNGSLWLPWFHEFGVSFNKVALNVIYAWMGAGSESDGRFYVAHKQTQNQNHRTVWLSGLFSLRRKTSCHQIARNIEATIQGIRVVWSLWKLACVLATVPIRQL